MIPFADLLAGTTAGPANEAGQTLTILSVGNAVGGSVAIDGTDVTFTPAANFNGTASFSYTVQDSGGTADGGADSATLTASFTVNAVNDAPTASNLTQSLALLEDAAPVKLFGAAPVLADVDGDAVTVTLTLADPSAGVLVGAGPGAGGVYTVSGTVAAVNAALAALTFDSAPDYNGATSVTASR